MSNYHENYQQNWRTAQQSSWNSYETPQVFNHPSSAGMVGAMQMFRDDKNRRIIARESLYQNPDLFYGVQPDEGSDSNQQNNWTQQYWQKAGETRVQNNGIIYVDHQQRSTSYRQNKIEKKLQQSLAQPAKMSKAESMMQKMGWQGGALGKAGDGIVEPIAPNAAYAYKTLGFGQKVKIQQNRKIPTRNVKSRELKEYFKTNVLLHLLEFVKDYSEVEIVFDEKLFKQERKRIHVLVDSINNNDVVVIEYDNMTQMDLVRQIHANNIFVLRTQSEGETPNRKLCIYKEAPEYMYLVTPSDLKYPPEEEIEEEEIIEIDDEETETDTKKQTELKMSNQDTKEIHKGNKTESTDQMEIEDENPFMKGIKKHIKQNVKEKEITDNLKNECEIATEPTVLEKLIGFLSEFALDEDYTEFRFLGTFEENDWLVIDRFLNELRSNIDNPDVLFKGEGGESLDGLKSEDCGFEVKEDYIGYTVIYKYSKKDAAKNEPLEVDGSSNERNQCQNQIPAKSETLETDNKVR